MHWRIAIYFNETYFSQPFGWLKKKLILCMLMWNVDVKCVFNSFQFFFFSYPFWFLGSHSVQVLSKILERKDKIIPEWKLTTNTNTSSNKYINAIKYLRALYSLSLSLVQFQYIERVDAFPVYRMSYIPIFWLCNLQEIKINDQNVAFHS